MQPQRVLPTRKNRGKCFRFDQEEKILETASTNQKQHKQARKKASVDSNSNAKVKVFNKEKVEEEEADFLEKNTNLIKNKILFPYTRNFHYYFDLILFQRLEGTPTYAKNQANIFNFTFSQENQKRGESTISQLINRKYIQLPCTKVQREKNRTKNICHQFLFSNEDKKYQLDRSILQLKQICKNLTKFINNGKIDQFGVLRKDPELSQVLSEEIGEEEKRIILNQKISALILKKKNSQKFFMSQDQIYFHHSLNQKLHNNIDDEELKTSWNQLIEELNMKNEKRRHMKERLQSSLKKELQLSQLLEYDHCGQRNLVLSEKKLREVNSKISALFLSCDPDGNYLINIPEVFFYFSDQKMIEVAQRVIMNRLINHSQAAFYAGRKFWNKIFQTQFKLKKQPRVFSRDEYQKTFNNFLTSLKKYAHETLPIKYPFLDSLIQTENLSDHNINFLFKNESNSDIELREFILISIFHRISLILTRFSGFIRKNQVFLDLLGSEFYPKYHQLAISIIQKPCFGSLEDLLRKFVDFTMKTQISCEETLKWEYDKSLRVGYIVKIFQTKNAIEGLKDF